MCINTTDLMTAETKSWKFKGPRVKDKNSKMDKKREKCGFVKIARSSWLLTCDSAWCGIHYEEYKYFILIWF